jgi:hypothetical protein
MLGNRKLILDTFCEVHDLLEPWAEDEFWDLDSHTVISDAVYVIGRQQFHRHIELIKELVHSHRIKIVFSNPHEGSSTMLSQCVRLGIVDLIQDGTIQIVTGGGMELPCLIYDSFLPKVLDYKENLQAIQHYSTNWRDRRPYKFLFLNGRHRPHRKQLLELLEPVLNWAIWSNLDDQNGPIQTLSGQYEFDLYQNRPVSTGYVKSELFDGQWGEIYLKSDPYTDTYFSVVSETVFDYPYSFRTEKIWKPIAMGHPFVAVANAGYYRDLHELGFKTFGHVIDESFDAIADNQARLERIAHIVKDLCQQDLASFAQECYNVCKYNQEHLANMRVRVRQEFPDQFLQFINE